MSVEAPPAAAADERQVTLDLLKALHPIWHDIRERRRRTAPVTEYFVPSGDHRVEAEWQENHGHMDGLLELLGVTTDGLAA